MELESLVKMFRDSDLRDMDVMIRGYPLISGDTDFLEFFRRVHDEGILKSKSLYSIYILHLAIRYGLVTDLSPYRDFMNDDSITILENELQKSRCTEERYEGKKKYSKITDVHPEILSDYLINMTNILIRSIPIHDMIMLSIRNEKTKMICSLIRFTNSISTIVRDTSDFKYFLKVIKVLLQRSNYYLVSTIISGLSNVPKKYRNFIRRLSDITMTNDYHTFLHKIDYQNDKFSRGITIPFIGTILTDIMHSYELCNIADAEGVMVILRRLYDTLEMFNVQTGVSRIDEYVDDLVQSLINGISIYRREMSEWSEEDVSSFIQNSLKNRRLGQMIIDSTVEIFLRHSIDGRELLTITMEDIRSMKIPRIAGKRIIRRVSEYNTGRISRFDSIHDVCMVLKKYNVVRYDEIIREGITPNLLKYLDERDIRELGITPDILSILKRYRRHHISRTLQKTTDSTD